MTPRGPRGDQSQQFDQRFLLFMLMSVTILIFFNGLTARPPVEPAGEVAQAAPEQEADGAEAAEQTGDSGGVADQTPPSKSQTGEQQPAESEPVADEPVAEPQKVGLGSIDPDSPYRMLITLDNVGAGVERIELSSDEYRDLDDRSGYLGRLSTIDAPVGGAQVTVVGRGTPAEQAGIAVGDIIRSARVVEGPRAAALSESVSITSASDLERWLDATTPRQTIELGVRPADGAEQQVRLKLIRQPLDLVRPEAENVRLHSPDVADDYESVASLLVRLTRVGSLGVESPELIAANTQLEDETWAIEESTERSAIFRKTISSLGIAVTKRYTLAEIAGEEGEPAYHFDLEVEVANLGADEKAIAYELTGPNGLPIEGFWYAYKVGRGFSSYGLRDVVVRYTNDRFTQIACSAVANGNVDPMGQGKPLAYAGVDAQYFAAIVIPEKPSLSDVCFSEVRAELATKPLGEKARDTWQNASFVMARQAETLPPGGVSIADSYRVFAGPKLPELLAKYQAGGDPAHAIDGVLYYGWFGWAARPMLGLLHIFNSIVGNYGIAIILLTVVVRGAMFPLSKHQQQSMQKMQLLKPELDRITERYKTDMQKRSQAQQELFRKHNYNPAAGCMPMFIQLPIFIGLYRALAVDVELRQAPLFSDSIRFCSNLAAPDMFYDWSAITPSWWDNGQGIIALGPYLNLLPILSVVLFLVQSKMTMPEPTNDQMRLQQQMMKYMMGFMGLLLFKVASGLALYFIASSLWGVAERKLLPKPAMPASTGETPKPLPEKPVRTGGNKPPRGGRKKSGGKKKR